MTMWTEVRLACPKCKRFIIQEISVPIPNFAVEKMKNSNVQFEDEIDCYHCGNQISFWGGNSYYYLHLEFDGLEETEYQYSEPEYDFKEYEEDEIYEHKGIKGILSDRKISSLYHFSKIENLKSICTRGLIPRAKLSPEEFEFSDKYRADGLLNANCISVSFPQYKMFYQKRKENLNQNWFLVEIDTKVLVDKKCAFFEKNAASRDVKEDIIRNRRSATAFEKMFVDIDGLPSRIERKLPDNFPTDPQAEILIFNSIESYYIKAIHFPSEELRKESLSKIGAIKSYITPELFSAREDSNWLNK